MKLPRSLVLVTAALAVSAALAFAGLARSAKAGGGIAGRSYVQTNLVSHIPGGLAARWGRGGRLDVAASCLSASGHDAIVV
jgi:hypothetical protein